ncbi:DUF4149 domain-containing protein [Parachitinimonas caeni]|uniref:DUF4149 domain-containing protein n=1 Tax=Parachitinimonas caeni TaxID=3031301 RepID=A0ABT7DXJ8_9NEIS|nr:DUF4149 domain-containing protein [Parachitinimonas caeni]MDK2124787.1 DUF4149 domain-containing protein [Parachitinimonas caeni]
MDAILIGLRSIFAYLWIGGLWIAGILVAPVLFQSLPNADAGRVAGKIFQVMAWIGMFSGAYILLIFFWQLGVKVFSTIEFWVIVLMLMLTCLNHFAIFPILSGIKSQMYQAAEGVFGGGFQSWHTISSAIYLLQSVLGVMFVVREGAVKTG